MNQVFLYTPTSFWNRTKVFKAIALSILLHVLLMFTFTLIFSRDHFIPPIKNVDKQKIAVLEKAQLDQHIVDLLQPESTRVAQDSKYLSTQNTYAEKETRQRAQQQSKAQKQARTEKRQKSYDFALSPEYILNDISQQYTQNSSPNNYLPELELGNETLLNAQKFKYASFYIRMKRQLESTWNPRPIIYSRNLNGQFYNTKLRIELDEHGYLEHVEIVASSGNSTLDEEAVRSVKYSAPFLNPPEQILNAQKKLIIPAWSFIVSKY